MDSEGVSKTPEQEKDKQDIMIETLKEILKWTKIMSIPHVKNTLSATLTSDQEKVVYQYSNGLTTSRELGTMVGVGHSTITRWWNTWAQAGIVEHVGVKGGERTRRLFSLLEFDIKVPLPQKIKGRPKKVELEAKEKVQQTSKD